ncbi:transporter substrate-binding domain-containing protein (plasmid) [Fusobacteria bacterium ZRK30]|nr:transporter substrate-binding domain-containing protein [Fusobacteria bacterium ZRK30]
MFFYKMFNFKKMCILLFIFLFQLSLSNPILRVGVYKDSIITNQQNKGYLIEEILKWGETSGYKIEIVIYEWAALEKDFIDGKIDAIYPVNITEKRKLYMVFTGIITSNPFSIYSKIPHTINSLEVLENKRVGTYNSQLFKENLEDKIKGLKYVNTKKKLFEDYYNGVFDYIITYHESIRKNTKEFNVVGNLWFEDEGRIGLQKKYKHLISSLNSHFLQKNGNLKSEILKKAEDEKNNDLIFKTKQMVKYKKPVKLDIIVHKLAKPFVRMENGQLAGDSIEVIELFNKLSPYIYLNIIQADAQDSFNNEVEALKNGERDAMFPMGITKKRDEKFKKVDLTYNDYIILLGNKSSPKVSSIYEAKGLIGVAESKMLENLLLKNIPRQKIRKFEKRKTALDALNEGKINYLIDVQTTSEDYLSKKKYINIVKVLEVSPIEYRFYLTPNIDERIYEDINLIVEFINNEEGTRIVIAEKVPAYLSKNLKIFKFLMLIIIIIIGFYRWKYIKEKINSEKIFKALIGSLENVNHINHMETGIHIERVGGYSEILAKGLKLPRETTKEIKIFASLHDVGKVVIPKEILNKSGKLTEEEFEIIKNHTIKGAEIIDNLKNISKNPNLAINIALYHHEKWNGRGYPEGLVGEDIPIEARIVGLADVYDALRMPRVYKEGFTHEKAYEIILEDSGEHFDPKLVDIFKQKNKEFKNIYDLSLK